MVRFLLIILAIVLLVFASQSKTNAQKAISTQRNDQLPWLEFKELKINGISLYESRAKVVKQFGKPLSEKRTGVYPCGDLEKTLRYSGLTVTLEKDNDSNNYNAVAMEITSAKWSLSGIKIGANKKDVLEKFKNYYHHESKEGKKIGLHYSNGDGGTSFYFRNDKLVLIELESNWC